MGDLGIEAVKDRLPEARRNLAGAHRNPGTDGITFLGQGSHVFFHRPDLGGIRTEEGIALDLGIIHRLDGDWT